MPTLRPSSQQQVLNELAASRFGIVGFDISFPDSGDLVVISFALKRNLMFTVSGSGTTANPLVAKMSPGEYKNQDALRCDSFDSCLGQIQPWVRRIHEDLKIQDPKISELHAFRETLEAHVKANVTNEASLFTAEEVRDLTEKLDALTSRLEEMEQRHELTEKELKSLKQVVADARSDLPELPKGMWYRTAGGKVWEALKKAAGTSEGKQVLAEAAKKLIGL